MRLINSISTALALFAGASSMVRARPLQRRDTSKPFGVITTHSTSPIHFASLAATNNDGNIYVAYNSGLTFYIEDGYLKIEGSNDIVYIDPATLAVKYASEPPVGAITKTWDLGSIYLELDNMASGIACPISSGYQFYWAVADSDLTGICGSGVEGIGAGTVYSYASESPSETSSIATTTTSTTSSVPAASSSGVTEASNLFAVVAVHSGSAIQYSPLSITGDGKIYFGADEDIATYIEGGYLKIYGSNQVIYVDATTREIKYGDIPAVQDVYSTWSLSSSSVLLNGQANAVACKTAKGYQVYWASTDPQSICSGNGIGADLYYTFVSPSSAPAVATSTAFATTVSAATMPTTIETVVTTIYCSTASEAATTTAAAEKTTTTVDESASVATVSLLPPNLLIPAKEAQPSQVFGTQFTGTIVKADGSDVVTFVSFDVPPLSSKQVSSCHLLWTPPSKDSFPSTITGSKKVNVYALTSSIDEFTLSWDNRPTRGSLVGSFDATSGVFTHSSVECKFSEKQQFELVGEGSEDEVSWFQTWNPLTGFSYLMLA
ncbi:ubiquitin 3 binding protein But2 C-terminal domain-containing protein [Lipomyces orientalis]|uniref:Ubiquitin 3 binding protein But2 C-terminal domain-containing protein n=1 Tax=Lipomyces orientalis TaxID=1233043 RepID=A0ACC3TY64_9ASCO